MGIFCNWDIIHTSSLFFRREKALSEMGLRMVRFRNDEVEMNLSTVVGKNRNFPSIIFMVDPKNYLI